MPRYTFYRFQPQNATGPNSRFHYHSACLSLWDLTVDAYIIGTIAERAGYSSIYAFIEELPKCDNLSTLIEGLAKELIDLDYTMKQRNEPLLNRDAVFENRTLLLQHGLILRNYLLAMRHGDSGLVRISLKIFTIWFQATRKHNYAQETIHLTACLERVSSPEMREFWMDNCLINPSGNPTGFQSCNFIFVVSVAYASASLPVSDFYSKYAKLKMMGKYVPTNLNPQCKAAIHIIIPHSPHPLV